MTAEADDRTRALRRPLDRAFIYGVCAALADQWDEHRLPLVRSLWVLFTLLCAVLALAWPPLWLLPPVWAYLILRLVLPSDSERPAPPNRGVVRGLIVSLIAFGALVFAIDRTMPLLIEQFEQLGAELPQLTLHVIRVMEMHEEASLLAWLALLLIAVPQSLTQLPVRQRVVWSAAIGAALLVMAILLALTAATGSRALGAVLDLPIVAVVSVCRFPVLAVLTGAWLVLLADAPQAQRRLWWVYLTLLTLAAGVMCLGLVGPMGLMG